MENIGNKAKAASKFEVPYVDVIIDVGVGIYDNCQSGASAREFISDAVVDVVLTTGDGKSLRDNIKDFVFGLIDGNNGRKERQMSI